MAPQNNIKNNNQGLLAANSKTNDQNVSKGNAGFGSAGGMQSPTGSQAAGAGANGGETMTFRGNLEMLEKVLIDVVSELKYHRRQIEIISAEKDTSGAV